VCKQHSATTALVLWNYNIALEQMYALTGRSYAPAQVSSCISGVFSRFCGCIYNFFFFIVEILNGFIVKRKYLGSLVVCVCDIVYSACVFVSFL